MSPPRRSALQRSFDVYYRDRARTERMDRLNAQFVPPGGLAFDIGAHVGDRAGSFLRLGARVVVAEPQPKMFRALRLLYGRRTDVHLHRIAIGAAPGELALFVNAANPTITTASPDLITAAQNALTWQGQVWNERLTVPVTTLDALIAQHGRPDFTKIDVEGHELEVLRGLSRPLPALSFEFTTIQRDVAIACLARLRQLGRYMFNYSLGEQHQLRDAEWISASAMQECLLALPEAANSGDIFARL